MPMYSFSSRSNTSTFSAVMSTFHVFARGIARCPYCRPYPGASLKSGKLAGGDRRGVSAGAVLVLRRGHSVLLVGVG
jgi:hypothetical protein